MLQANTTAAVCAACCSGENTSAVTFSDPDAGSLLDPASKLFASVVAVDAAASTLTASLPPGTAFTSSKGRVQVEFLFENAPLCGVYNGVGGANDHTGVVATPLGMGARWSMGEERRTREAHGRGGEGRGHDGGGRGERRGEREGCIGAVLVLLDE